MKVGLQILVLIAVVGAASFACKVEQQPQNANVGAAGASSNAVVNKPAVAGTATPITTTPAVSATKRIAFGKGANWGSENVTLEPGMAQKFVVRASKGQTMDVEVASKETAVNLISGKAKTTEDFGFLSADLLANGDYVFEVRNPTKRAIKTSLKVTIESNDGEPPGDGAEDSDIEN